MFAGANGSGPVVPDPSTGLRARGRRWLRSALRRTAFRRPSGAACGRRVRART